MGQYRTKDIDEAAFLWMHPTVRYDDAARDGHTVYFSFSSDSDLDAMVKDFHAKKAQVEPKSFSQRQKDVRDILHKLRG